MEKIKRYREIKFDSKTISKLDAALKKIGDGKPEYPSLEVRNADEEWTFETPLEFLAAVDSWSGYSFSARIQKPITYVSVSFGFGDSSVRISAPDRAAIESLFTVSDQDAERCRVPREPDKPDEKGEAKVFIGHGRSAQWNDLKDHLHEKHGYVIEAYEIGSRAGHTIRDILEEMLRTSSVALLVMTGEDKDQDGKLHPRENVVHETRLFQGRLGFSRAAILLEDGTQEFSNIHGIQQIRFAKGNIKEAFGDVLAFLKRELG